MCDRFTYIGKMLEIRYPASADNLITYILIWSLLWKIAFLATLQYLIK